MVDGFFGKTMILARSFWGSYASCLFCRGHLFFHGRACFGVVVVLFFNGEFDPGSGRTLAACLTHASRAERPLRGYSSGERVSNTWVTCPWLWDNPGKPRLIPDTTRGRMACGWKG